MSILIQQFNNLELASNTVVEHITKITRSAVAEKGFCSIVLAGGQTPQLAYKLLNEQIKAEQLNWQHCHFFWGDERWVASKHPDSNYFMAHKNLLSGVQISPENIHPILTGYQTPETGAEIYEKHLRDFFYSQTQTGAGRSSGNTTFPSFDLILLGMGTDGHTASLFPGSGYLKEKVKWVTAVKEGLGSPPVARITLTLPIINQAQNILFLISGKKKRKLLDTFISKPVLGDDARYPAAHVKPAGRLIWVIAEED